MRELKIHKLYRMDGNIVYIDITIDFYREVFNTWDFSPLLNRDLDDDLFEYLESCCREIPKRYKINIVLHLPEDVRDVEKEKLNTLSFKNFFMYKKRKILISRRSLFFGALRYLLFGGAFISIGYLMERVINMNDFFAIIREGFFIGGWVLFWELFTTLFFKTNETRESMEILQRLHNAEISYIYNNR